MRTTEGQNGFSKKQKKTQKAEPKPTLNFKNCLCVCVHIILHTMQHSTGTSSYPPYSHHHWKVGGRTSANISFHKAVNSFLMAHHRLFINLRYKPPS